MASSRWGANTGCGNSLSMVRVVGRDCARTRQCAFRSRMISRMRASQVVRLTSHIRLQGTSHIRPFPCVSGNRTQDTLDPLAGTRP